MILIYVQIFRNNYNVTIFFSYIASLKCTPSDKQMHPWGYMYPRLGTSVLERQYRHFRLSAFLFSQVTVGDGTSQLDWLGTSHQLNSSLGMLKV